MVIEFMKLYNAQTAIDDIRVDLSNVNDVLKKVDEWLNETRGVAMSEKRLMARGGGSTYEYFTFTDFNYTIDIHIIPPVLKLHEIIMEIRNKLKRVGEALSKTMGVLEKLGDDVKGLRLIGVLIEDDEIKLILIP